MRFREASICSFYRHDILSQTIILKRKKREWLPTMIDVLKRFKCAAFEKWVVNNQLCKSSFRKNWADIFEYAKRKDEKNLTKQKSFHFSIKKHAFVHLLFILWNISNEERRADS